MDEAGRTGQAGDQSFSILSKVILLTLIYSKNDHVCSIAVGTVDNTAEPTTLEVVSL